MKFLTYITSLVYGNIKSKTYNFNQLFVLSKMDSRHIDENPTFNDCKIVRTQTQFGHDFRRAGASYYGVRPDGTVKKVFKVFRII